MDNQKMNYGTAQDILFYGSKHRIIAVAYCDRLLQRRLVQYPEILGYLWEQFQPINHLIDVKSKRQFKRLLREVRKDLEDMDIIYCTIHGHVVSKRKTYPYEPTLNSMVDNFSEFGYKVGGAEPDRILEAIQVITEGPNIKIRMPDYSKYKAIIELKPRVKEKTPEELFEDYLEEEYQAAVKDSDEYFKTEKKQEEEKEDELAKKITKIIWYAIVGGIYTSAAWGTYLILKGIIGAALDGG